jgi:hypothetical protein
MLKLLLNASSENWVVSHDSSKNGIKTWGVYFPKNNKGDLLVERHRIKISTPRMGKIKRKRINPN